MVRSVLLLVLLDMIFIIQGQDNNGTNLIRKIRNGLILGREAVTDSQTKYLAFEGIPYAQPPIGDLRFRAPVLPKDWSGVLNATYDRGECAQDLYKGTEDCLYLNVYTTNIDSSRSLPVMVWIYGGFFLVGSSNYSDYGPDYFLDEHVIVVTLNYRLSVFGFLSTQDMSAAGNWGLKDQILALKWVKENIESFGGNSNRVTIFGESAGGASVSYLTQTNLTHGLFQQAIMESGTSQNLWALIRDPRRTAFKLGMSLGILTTDSTRLIQELRKVDYIKLLTVATVVDLGETALSNLRDGLIFSPSVEPIHKDAVVWGKSHENLKNGLFNKMPMIIGFNSAEGVPFAQLLEKVKLYLLTYDIWPARLIPIDMNVNPLNSHTVANKIKEHYFGRGLVAVSSEKLMQYVTDDQFVRPISEAVRLISNYAPVYFYRFSYVGNLGLRPPGESGRKFLGVGHAEDLGYLWKISTNTRDATRLDALIRHRLIKLWTNFAKTGNPTPEPDPLFQNVTWTPATPKSQFYLDIGRNLRMDSNLNAYSIPWWSELYKAYGHPPYDTY